MNAFFKIEGSQIQLEAIVSYILVSIMFNTVS